MTGRTVPKETRQSRTLAERVEERGFKRGSYAFCFVAGEGKFLPTSAAGDELEEASGYVLDGVGHLFAFWFGWNAEEGRADFTEWEEVEPERDWAEEEEYQ